MKRHLRRQTIKHNMEERFVGLETVYALIRRETTPKTTHNTIVSIDCDSCDMLIVFVVTVVIVGWTVAFEDRMPIRAIDIFTNYASSPERKYDVRRRWDDYADRQDVLESEFGVFDRNYDRYVYYDYPIRKPTTTQQQFDDKLNLLLNNTVRLHFHNNDLAYSGSSLSNALSSPIKSNKFKATTTTTTTTTTTEKPSNSDATRQRLTNILRRYLIKMHKKRFPKARKHTRAFYDKVSVAEIDTNQNRVDSNEVNGKFIAYPLEHWKNKTIKFANKFLSLFTVVQFPNFKCQATNALGQYEGTCFLPSECATLNGVAMGQCAQGNGVCCVFRSTCGGVSSNNCTYLESPNYPNYYPTNGGVVTPTPQTSTQNTLTPDPRFPTMMEERAARELDDLYERQLNVGQNFALACNFRIYKSTANIKQMRIDFIDLELKGPTNGNCIDERLVITGLNISPPPIICGYNTGQHMYVDVSSLQGPLQIAVLANQANPKRYKLRVCQFNDGCSGLQNCLQYFTGVSGVITSFNYDQAATFSRSNSSYLNNLNYAICIKREPGYCSVTYTNVANNVQYPFQLRNFDDGALTVPAGQAGAGVINCPDDYIVINGIRLCGDRLNDGSVQENFALNAPVTDFSAGPIIIPVKTSPTIVGQGFKLFYTQNPCGTNPVLPTTATNSLRPDPRL